MKILLVFFFGFYVCSSALAQNARDSLLLLLSKSVENEEKALLHHNIGWEYYPNAPDSMRFFFGKALSSTKKPLTIANSQRGMGVASYLLTDYQNAMDFYLKSLDGFQSLKDNLGVARCYNSIGLCLSSLKNYQAAVAYHWKSMGILQKMLNTYSDADTLLKAKKALGHNYINLIVSYEESPQKDSTLYYTQKSIALFQSMNDSLYLAMSYNRKAQALYRLGRYSEAIESNRFVFNTFKELSPFEETFTYLGIAQNSVELGNIEVGIKYGLKAYELAKKNGANWHLQHCARVLSKAYAQQKKFDKAYSYHVKFKALSDTLFNQASERKISNLMLEQQELRNEKLIQENRANEEQIKVKNQQIFMFIGSFAVLCSIIIIIYLNSRKYRKLNDQLVTVNQQLQESNLSKDKFFSIIGHDLKSPFNSIIGFLHLLKTQLEKLSKDDIMRFADMMLSTTNNTYKLLENLLEWSRLQTGDISFNPTVFEINEVVDENISLFSKTSENKNITLSATKSEIYKVSADRNMVEVILRNLISNAIKFTKNGGAVTIAYTTTNENRLQLSVTDNGIGIPKDIQLKLFDVTEKFSMQGTNQEKGTGLGLSLSKEFAEQHGSSIKVESEENKGSTFSFTLPLA